MPLCCAAQDFYIHYPNLSSTVTLAMFRNRVSTWAIWMNVSWEYWGRRTLGTSLTASTWRKRFNQEMTVTGQSSHFKACQWNFKKSISNYIYMHVLYNVYSRVERLSSSPTINQYQYFCCINLIEFCAQNKTSILALFKNLFKIIFIFWDRHMLCPCM